MPRVLCIHGVGHAEADPTWQEGWKTAIQAGLQQGDPQIQVEVDYLAFDELFDFTISAGTIVEALGKMTASGVNSVLSDVQDWWGGLWGRQRGLLGDIKSQVGWTAGMVVQWAGDARLRGQLRLLVADRIRNFKPDVICAHSLGSLVCYDTFVHEDTKDCIEGGTFVSLGSQIGNDFVKGIFGGRIGLPQARLWYHLYNSHDWVFTSPINIAAANFEEVETDFEEPPLNHSAIQYLSNENARAMVWTALALPSRKRALARGSQAVAQTSAFPRRALLVGINNYPNPENRLEGCVNDVFLMSAVLQETGFSPDEIRVVLDERATAISILDRLQWLLDGVRAGDLRFFFYSGHGAQLPGYGINGTPDRLHSTLVPYDFNWTAQTAITDDKFDDLYSQLPYEAHFVVALDCCYSGGMARRGGLRVRGLDPPDDINHRMICWDPEHEMWVPRKIPSPNKDLAARKYRDLYLGASGVERRLGRASSLRSLPDRSYDRIRRELRHKGPYLPIIYEACGPNQYSCEYRHGVTSYGAFTYSLARILRYYRTRRETITFIKLLQEVKTTLADLHYDQDPTLLGPADLLKQKIPWQPVGPTRERTGRR